MFTDLPINKTPLHGGRLQEAIKEGTLPADQWLDLSTGINPTPWPAPAIPQAIFQRLPESNQDLESVAADYYFQSNPNLRNTHKILAIPGSQWFIQYFPNIIKSVSKTESLNVLVPQFGFTEHSYWWQQHNHQLHRYSDSDLNGLLEGSLNADVLVIINPNNPTTKAVSPEQLCKAAINNPKTLLIVDEAFVDSRAELSLLTQSPPKNIIVLRSMGKFFGLAGLRVGFVIAHSAVIEWLTPHLGPWSIANPSQWLARKALKDFDWHNKAMQELHYSANQLEETLKGLLKNHIQTITKTDYFVTLKCSDEATATDLYECFKQEGILIRLIEESALIRIGLPTSSQFPILCERLEKIKLKR